MKTKNVIIYLLLALLFIVSACSNVKKVDSQEVTLDFTFGQKTGTYSGEMVDGLPNGYGTFTSANSDGVEWTYEGYWKEGHFDGEGKTTWGDGNVNIGTYKNDEIVPMKGDELETLYSATDDYIDHCVEIKGEVFIAPEYIDTNVVGFQIWGDVENADKNILIFVHESNIDLKEGDKIKVTGYVRGVLEENAFGTEATAPIIYAYEYSVIS